MRGEDTWAFLAEFKASPATRAIPVIVVTFLDDSRKAFALNADAFAQKPPTRRWLLETLQRLVVGESRKALIIDDEEAARYLLGRVLSELGWTVVEAPDGKSGLEIARTERPDAVLLDLDLPDCDGGEVLNGLRSADTTRNIPVLVTSSRELGGPAPSLEGTLGVVPKSLSRGETRARLVELLQGLPAGPGVRPAPAARGEAS